MWLEGLSSLPGVDSNRRWLLPHQSIHDMFRTLMETKVKQEVRDGEAETQQEVGCSWVEGGGGARGGAGGGRHGTEDDAKHLV